MEAVFTNVYENSVWGTNNNSRYNGSSGSGSSLEYNSDIYIPFLKKFIHDNHVRTVVDLGCGDFQCGSAIYDTLDITYTGYDAYSRVVDFNTSVHAAPKYVFKHLDILNGRDDIVSADLCILKDILQHWALADIYTFMDSIIASKKFKSVLIINCSDQTRDNTDIRPGDYRYLSARFLPLRKYNPAILLTYKSKEISVIRAE